MLDFEITVTKSFTCNSSHFWVNFKNRKAYRLARRKENIVYTIIFYELVSAVGSSDYYLGYGVMELFEWIHSLLDWECSVHVYTVHIIFGQAQTILNYISSFIAKGVCIKCKVFMKGVIGAWQCFISSIYSDGLSLQSVWSSSIRSPITLGWAAD